MQLGLVLVAIHEAVLAFGLEGAADAHGEVDRACGGGGNGDLGLAVRFRSPGIIVVDDLSGEGALPLAAAQDEAAARRQVEVVALVIDAAVDVPLLSALDEDRSRVQDAEGGEADTMIRRRRMRREDDGEDRHQRSDARGREWNRVSA